MTNDFQPSPRASSIFLREGTLEALKRTVIKAPEVSMAAVSSKIFGNIKIYVENDPATRKARAILEAIEGRSCIYEGEDGELIQLPTVRDLPSLIDCPTMAINTNPPI